MREIKFRAWDIREGKMYIVDGFNDTFVYARLSTLVNRTLVRKNVILMQYTGLKDSNGIEIYEGDILAPIWEENSERYIVEWNNDNCCFTSIEGGINNYIGDINNEVPYSLLSNVRLDVCKVIGNIHDNPELLKEVN